MIEKTGCVPTEVQLRNVLHYCVDLSFNALFSYGKYVQSTFCDTLCLGQGAVENLIEYEVWPLEQ